MKSTRLLMILMSLFAVPVSGQVEHAATPEQCRADADAWGIPKWGLLLPNEADFQNLANVMMRDGAVSARAMNARRNELVQCTKTDSVQANRYSEASRAYAIAEMARMVDYMQRHSLMTRFYQEDEQGSR